MGRTDAFRQMLDDLGADWTERAGAAVVSRYTDVDAEYEAIAGAGFAVVDRSERELVVCTGVDVVELLQGLVTSDVFALAEPGAGQATCAVDVNGRMVGDARLLHVEDMLLMDLEPGLIADGFVAHFRGNVISEDARFTDRSGATARIGVFGAGAASALTGLIDLAHDPAELADWSATWGTRDGVDLIVQRVRWTSAPGFEIVCGVDEAAGVLDALIASGGTPAGFEALETHRVEAGIPRWGAELDRRVIPLEAGLDDALSFDKGCYLGQEIIARLDTLGEPARRLRTLVLEGDHVPERGTDVTDDDKTVGEVRSAVYSPAIGAPIALAYLKRKHNDPGLQVRVGDAAAVVRTKPT